MTKYTFIFTFKLRSINVRENPMDIADIQETRHKTKISKTKHTHTHTTKQMSNADYTKNGGEPRSSRWVSSFFCYKTPVVILMQSNHVKHLVDNSNSIKKKST